MVGSAALVATASQAAGAGQTSSSSDLASDPAAQTALIRAEQAWQRQRAYRASSQGRDERAASRDAYRSQSDREAFATAQHHFPTLVDAPPLRWPQLQRGEALKRYFDNNTALVREPSGNAALLASTLPLQGQTPGRNNAPIDLGLVDDGSWLVPKSTASPVQIPRRSDRELRFPAESFGVALDSATAGGVQLTSNGAYFANALADGDLVIQPSASGAELSLVLRSPASPAEPALKFDLGPGQRLQLAAAGGPEPAPPGAAEVVAGGKRVALIAPASALDAQGQPIAVTYRVDGDRLLMAVADRGDVAWPVLVDPVIYEHNDYGQPLPAGLGASWTDWHPQSNKWNPPSSAPTCAGSWFWLCPLSDGTLRANGYQGTTYVGWDYGEWLNTVRPGIYMFRFDAANMSHTPDSVAAGTRVAGICENSCSAWPTRGLWWPGVGTGTQQANSYHYVGPAESSVFEHYCVDAPLPQDPNQPTPCTGNWPANDPAALGDAAVFQLLMGSGRAASRPLAVIGGAATYVTDNSPPSLDAPTHSAPVPTGWVGSYSDTVTLTPRDNGSTGLGSNLKGVGMGTVTVSGGGQSQTQGSGCPLNESYNTCGPTNRDSSVSWDSWHPALSYTAPEGVNTYTASATDIVGNHDASQDKTWQVKVDNTPPTVQLSGSLYDARGSYAPVDGTLNFTATDGANDGNPADARSGVASVVVKVDGQQKASFSNPSPCDSCSLSNTWSYHASDYSPGKHTVSVVATDEAGHVTAAGSYTFDVYTDDQSPQTSISGTLWDAQDSTISEASYDLSVEAGDGTTGGPGVGVRSIVIQVDGAQAFSQSQSCDAGNCGMDVSWTLNTANYADGPHEITITVTDQAGNSTVDSETVTVKHTQALPAQTLDTTAAAAWRLDGALIGERAGSAVANLGDLNGDGLDDYAIGAPNATTVKGVRSGEVYVVFGKAGTPPPLDLANFGAGDGFTISGPSSAQYCGTAVAPAGDVNGDGFPDLLVACPGWDGSLPGTSVQGHVFVVFGGATTNVDLGNLGSRGFAVNGPVLPALLLSPGDHTFGSTLGGPLAGRYESTADVNGDGLADVVIGSGSESNNGRPSSGSAYVVFGKATTGAIDVSSLGSQGFRIDGATPAAHAGFAAAVVGDLNGDDNADVVVTAPGQDLPARTNAGTAYVVFGKSDTANVDLSALGTAGYPIYGDTGDKLGSSVAAVGDLDNDGVADFAIGGHGAFVVFGQDTTDPVDFATPDLGYKVLPPDATGYDTSSVAGGGDLNGDTLPDVLLGFPSAQGGSGEFYALLSQEGIDPTSAPVSLTSLPGQMGSRFTASGIAGETGAALAGLDVGLDGQAALLIGAPNSSAYSRSGSGSAYVVPASRMSGASAQGASSHDETKYPDGQRKCWLNRGPYPLYNHLDIPKVCRATDLGNYDQTRRPSKYGYHRNSKGWNHKRPNGPHMFRPLRTGAVLGNGSRVPIFDSTGTKIGEIRQHTGHYTDIFTLYNASGQPVHTNDQTDPTNESDPPPPHTHQIFLKSETAPCMTNGQTENYALVSLQPKNAYGPQDALMGLRFLVPRTALVTSKWGNHSLDKSGTNTQVIDGGWKACNNRYSHRYSAPPPQSYPVQPWVLDDMYQSLSSAGAGGCVIHRDRYPRGEFDQNCGGRLYNYQAPNRADIPGFPKIAVMTESTTSVQPGGIERAVFAVSSGSPISATLADQMRYSDPNVPCTTDLAHPRYYVAHWLFLKIGSVFGWLPERRPGQINGGSYRSGCPTQDPR